MTNIDLDKKYNYKIRNKKTGRYLTGNKSKSTWARSSAVLDRTRRLNDDWEIILFPLEDPLTISIIDFKNHYEEKRQAKIDKKNESAKKAELAKLQKIEFDEKRQLDLLNAKYPNHIKN